MNILFSKKAGRPLAQTLHKHVKFNYLIIIIIALLVGLFIFNLINLLTTFRLYQKWPVTQSETTPNPKPAAMRYYEEPINRVIVPEAANLAISSSSTEILIEIPVNSTSAVNSEVNPIIDQTINSATGTATPIVVPNQIETIKEVTPLPIDDRNDWKYNVFGDSFSNSYYVNMSKTDFYYDDMATAFSFTPIYEKREVGLCEEEYCGFSERLKIDGQENIINQKYCLTKKPQLCVSWDGEKLKYNDDEVKDFTVLFSSSGGKPDRVSIYPLANYWLIGAIWTENGQEMGRAWRFDGENLITLDPENRVPFVTRQGYSGSNIYFGGDDSNYLVLYSGYDLIGYQVVDNALWNITDFFNIRLTTGGFIPQIIKQQQGAETVWYICSLTTNKPKLIKLWQNGSEVIRGLLSFGENFFSGGYTSAICKESSEGNLEISTAKKNKETVSYNRWILIDNGFDQSHDYQVMSVDLFSGKGEIKMANFSGVSLCGANSCQRESLSGSLNFTISNDGYNFFVPNFDQEYLFATSGNKLFWKLQASSDRDKSYYSPWFGAINSVYYAWIE